MRGAVVEKLGNSLASGFGRICLFAGKGAEGDVEAAVDSASVI